MFKLILQTDTEKTINQPTEEDIKASVAALNNGLDYFIILETDTLSDRFEFIQAICSKEECSDEECSDEEKYYVEVKYMVNDIGHIYGKDDFNYTEVVELFINFRKGKNPDIEQWGHVMDLVESGHFYSEIDLLNMLKNSGITALACVDLPEENIMLKTSDIAVFINFVKSNSINTVFYSYRFADKNRYNLSKANLKDVDNDLLNLAKKEVDDYNKLIKSTDFSRYAKLYLFCLHMGTCISLEVIAPWMNEVPTASMFYEHIEQKYAEDLDAVKRRRDSEKEDILDELKALLLKNKDFILCTNQKLRSDFIRKFLHNNEKYRQAFMDKNGYLNTYEASNYADMVYAIYKQKNK